MVSSERHQIPVHGGFPCHPYIPDEPIGCQGPELCPCGISHGTATEWRLLVWLQVLIRLGRPVGRLERPVSR